MENNNNVLPKREEIDSTYKWRLEDIYNDNELWEEDYAKIKKLMAQISGYKGKLSDGADVLLDFFRDFEELVSLNEKLFVYARMRRDEDNANPVYQAMTDRAMMLSTQVYAAVSFMVPEITKMDEHTHNGYLEMDKLKIFTQYFKEIRRRANHILSEREEEILALSSEIGNTSSDIFTMFNNADIKFPTIKDEDGENIELTKGRYKKLLESVDRRVRKDAFHGLYSSYYSMKNSVASMLSANVKRNRFYSSLRKYNSSLEASLDEDNITISVYDNLINTISNKLDLMYRYLELRKRALKLDSLHMYDVYVPIVDKPVDNIPYEKAASMVKEGLNPLGNTYAKDLEKAFSNGWIDVCENRGKTSGAYSWGSYLTHPYVLLNYQETVDDVFTLAHEMGHAMHSYYTNAAQPFIYSEYKIFVAEVASTVNESLLVRHMIDNSEDIKFKAYLLNHYLESFRGTVFRQTMFAEFEKIIHGKESDGEALTSELLCSVYKDLNRKYFGQGVVIDDDIEIEWARIPHFYNSFYVYKYATGFSAAASLSEQILNGSSGAVDRYLNFLSSGSSSCPLELLKKAGVDLTDPKPILDALNVFEETLDELENYI